MMQNVGKIRIKIPNRGHFHSAKRALFSQTKQTSTFPVPEITAFSLQLYDDWGGHLTCLMGVAAPYQPENLSLIFPKL